MALSGMTRTNNSLWIADSGASTHITTSDIGLFEIKNVNEPVQVGDGKFVYATKVGKLTVEYKSQKGDTACILLKNVKYIPGFSSNLFSLTAALAKNCSIYNKGWAIVVEKNKVCIKFNEEIKTQNGYVCGAHLIVERNDQALVMPARNKKCDVQLAHNLLRHVCEAIVWESAKFYGWMLKNKMTNCDSCAMAKSRQKNVPKAAMTKSKTPGERLFINISHPQSHSFGGSQYWLLVIDDATDYCFSIF